MYNLKPILDTLNLTNRHSSSLNPSELLEYILDMEQSVDSTLFSSSVRPITGNTEEREKIFFECIAKIIEVHQKFPDLRLAQIISNASDVSDVFYVSDKTILRGLETIKDGD